MPLSSRLLLVVLFAGCGAETEVGTPRPGAAGWFVDAGVDLGAHRVSDPEGWFEPEIMGPGAALFDADGDGDLDVYLVRGDRGGDSRNRLYVQEGADGWSFVDRTGASGLGDEGFGQGCAVGDLDGDGAPDVYVTNAGPDALYLGRGDGTFRAVSEEDGAGNPAWAVSASLFDPDLDGDLDVFVANYLDHDGGRECRDLAGRRDYCGPLPFAGTVDLLLVNDGGGRLVDGTLSAGLGEVRGRGLGVLASDLDGDGWPDVFVANDSEPNRLWINRAGRGFTDEALVRGLAVNAFGASEASMGVAYGDVDGDGDFDLFVTHLAGETNTLYRRDGDAGWLDVTPVTGLGPPSLPATGFGTALLDADLDGVLDLVVVNGGVSGGAAGGDRWGRYEQEDQFLRGVGDGRFVEARAEGGDLYGARTIGRGLASGDVDGDGDVDLLVTAVNGPARLLRNDAPREGRWLLVEVVDLERPAGARGARVEVEAGGRRHVREVDPHRSYASSSAPAVHVGLGDVDRVERVVVQWPDGTREDFGSCGVDQRVELRRGAGGA